MKPLQKPTIDPRVPRFRAALRVFERFIDRNSRDEGTCCGVTLSQCHALLALSDAETVSLKDLASRLNLDKSTLSRTVESLARDGLADRRTRPGDRRVCCISLTPGGRAAVNRINGTWNRIAASVLERVPGDERDRAVEGLEILARAFAETIPDEKTAACCGQEPTHE
jgi:DNA-binding MarR family transcriptional regulator